MWPHTFPVCETSGWKQTFLFNSSSGQQLDTSLDSGQFSQVNAAAAAASSVAVSLVTEACDVGGGDDDDDDDDDVDVENAVPHRCSTHSSSPPSSSTPLLPLVPPTSSSSACSSTSQSPTGSDASYRKCEPRDKCRNVASLWNPRPDSVEQKYRCTSPSRKGYTPRGIISSYLIVSHHVSLSPHIILTLSLSPYISLS